MLYTLNTSSWADHLFSLVEQESAIDALENGEVIYIPQLSFDFNLEEKKLFKPDILGKGTKNVSFDPRSGKIKGTVCKEDNALCLKNMMHRFWQNTRELIITLFPQYEHSVEDGRTSFRPAEILGRQSSLLKDDTRLHVDAFPATPNQGRRILRVFSNVNPIGQSRHWHLGEPFEAVVRHFRPKLKKPVFGLRRLLSILKMTKSYRSLYDHYMLMLHNQMKLDDGYQNKVKKTAVHFPSGSTWIVMTDHVSHAALSGQYMLEQTFYLSTSCMHKPERAPLAILERSLGKKLVDRL